MVKYFQKIKRKLLDKGSLRKYLVYAVGEILLIIIGILIALQFNDYKSMLDDRKKEMETLQYLKENLQKDTLELQRVANFKEQQLESCKYLIQFYVNPDLEVVDTAKFFNSILHLLYFILPSDHSTAFESAKSSGDLAKIDKDHLIQSLASYYSDIEMIQQFTDTKRYTKSINESFFQKKYRYEPRFGGFGQMLQQIYHLDKRKTQRI